MYNLMFWAVQIQAHVAQTGLCDAFVRDYFKPWINIHSVP